MTRMKEHQVNHFHVKLNILQTGHFQIKLDTLLCTYDAYEIKPIISKSKLDSYAKKNSS